MDHHSRRDFLKRLGLGAAAVSAAGGALSETQAQEPDPDAKPLGYAVVGIGSLAKGQILPALRTTKRSRLVALVSGDPAKARHYARLYGAPEKNIYNYQNYDQMASNSEIDVVYIVLPNSMHAEYTIRAAKAGKHVLSEKPMATTVKDAEEMVAVCRQAGKRLMVAYRLQYERYNLAAMKMCLEKQLGQVKMIDAEFAFTIGDPTQWRLKRAIAGGGSLMDIGIYCLQAARYLTGEEPLSVYAQQWSADPVKFKEVEENIAFMLRFPSGVIANCYSSYGVNYIDRYRVGGAEGWLEMEPAYVYKGLVQRVYKDGQFTLTSPSTWDHFAAEMDAFSEAIRQDRDVRTPGEEGLRDMRILMACYESAASGKPIPLG
ncbi:MAG: Gfo/Idh/MocA family oxidoreductase [Acidobacteria bacterium]|nr:Gfo/Idh/MocA family oxidoreductase [Acidobacteriota bacterium]